MAKRAGTQGSSPRARALPSRVLTVCVACAAAASTGCDTYEPMPLRLFDHLRTWTGTSLSQPAVQTYTQSALTALCGEGARLDVTDGLDLIEAEAVALYLNPRLRVARAEAEVPLALAMKAGLWPDPFLIADVLYVLLEGGIPWVIPTGAGLTIPLSGRLEVEKEQAWAEYSAAFRALAIAEWELLSDLRSAWLNYAAELQEIAAVEEHLQRMRQVREMAEKLVEAGELFPTDARVFAIGQESSASTLIDLKGQAIRLRLRVLELMGLQPASPVKLNATLCTFRVSVAPRQRPIEIVRRHPRIALLRAEYEVAEKALEREIHVQYPDVTIGPVYEFDQRQSRLGVGFGFPVPIWNRNQEGIAGATAGRIAAAQRAKAEVDLLISQAVRAQVSQDTSRQTAQRLRKVVVPLVESQIKQARALIELGESGVPVLRDALDSWLETRLAILRADLSEAQASNVLYTMLHPQWIATPPCPTNCLRQVRHPRTSAAGP